MDESNDATPIGPVERYSYSHAPMKLSFHQLASLFKLDSLNAVRTSPTVIVTWRGEMTRTLEEVDHIERLINPEEIVRVEVVAKFTEDGSWFHATVTGFAAHFYTKDGAGTRAADAVNIVRQRLERLQPKRSGGLWRVIFAYAAVTLLAFALSRVISAGLDRETPLQTNYWIGSGVAFVLQIAFFVWFNRWTQSNPPVWLFSTDPKAGSWSRQDVIGVVGIVVASIVAVVVGLVT